MDLDGMVDHWNTHLIRGSRHETVSGRPDALFNLPQRFGGQSDILQPVCPLKWQEVVDYVSSGEEPSANGIEQELMHVMQTEGLQMPATWEEGRQLFITLISREGIS